MKPEQKQSDQPTKMVLTSLQELQALLPDIDASEEENHPNDAYKNTYDLVALMMYLLGIDEKRFTEHIPPLTDHFIRYQGNPNARVIRNLCMIRTGLMQNYVRIVETFTYGLNNLGSLPEYISSAAVLELEEKNIIIQKSRPDAMAYIIATNKEISNRINNTKALFPDWINWDYIRPLFIMDGGTRPEGVKSAADFYNSDRNRYPFQCWMNWSRDGLGNIFHSDYKFVNVLYEDNEDTFENRSLVTAAGDRLLGDLYRFIEDHNKTLIVVDCENSDPIKLAAALSSLSPAQKCRIHKILLFDSDYTNAAWETLCSTGITGDFVMHHKNVARLYEHKSQVDMTLAVETSKEVFTNDVDSVILISSDSDYWALIRSLPEIDFMVMLEKMKSGQTIRQALESEGYIYCFIDDFCTAASYTIKTKTVLNALQSKLNELLDFNIHELLEEVMKITWLEMSDKEKANFYDRYVKGMRLAIAKDGNVRIILD